MLCEVGLEFHPFPWHSLLCAYPQRLTTHPDSCLKAFSRLRNALGSQAEQTETLCLRNSNSPQPWAAFSVFLLRSQRDGDSVPHDTCSLIDSMHCLPSFSCPTSPLPYQYFLCAPPVWDTCHRLTNYPKTQWLKITTILFCSQFCRSRIPAGPHWWFSCSALTEAVVVQSPGGLAGLQGTRWFHVCAWWFVRDGRKAALSWECQ